MFFKELALNRIVSSDNSEQEVPFPNCTYIDSGFNTMKKDEVRCFKSASFIASNNTDYEVTARYKNIRDREGNYSSPITKKIHLLFLATLHHHKLFHKLNVYLILDVNFK